MKTGATYCIGLLLFIAMVQVKADDQMYCGENQEYRNGTAGERVCVITTAKLANGEKIQIGFETENVNHTGLVACFCVNGTARNKEGMCVDERHCQEEKAEDCSPQEIYLPCKQQCPRTCDTIHDNITCSHFCENACFCKEGLVRNSTGVCVSSTECPKWCGGPASNQTLECGSDCDVTCADPTKVCPEKKPCVERCYCKHGYARNNAGACILISQCPAIIK